MAGIPSWEAPGGSTVRGRNLSTETRN